MHSPMNKSARSKHSSIEAFVKHSLTLFSLLAAGLLLTCTSAEPAPPKADEPAKLQETLIELEGLVELKGADTLFKLANGKVYKLEGSLVRMIRGVYKGKTIKTAGRILAEASSEPGRYAVREVIVILQ